MNPRKDHPQPSTSFPRRARVTGQIGPPSHEPLHVKLACQSPVEKKGGEREREKEGGQPPIPSRPFSVTYSSGNGHLTRKLRSSVASRMRRCLPGYKFNILRSGVFGAAGENVHRLRRGLSLRRRGGNGRPKGQKNKAGPAPRLAPTAVETLMASPPVARYTNPLPPLSLSLSPRRQRLSFLVSFSFNYTSPIRGKKRPEAVTGSHMRTPRGKVHRPPDATDFPGARGVGGGCAA